VPTYSALNSDNCPLPSIRGTSVQHHGADRNGQTVRIDQFNRTGV